MDNNILYVKITMVPVPTTTWRSASGSVRLSPWSACSQCRFNFDQEIIYAKSTQKYKENIIRPSHRI